MRLKVDVHVHSVYSGPHLKTAGTIGEIIAAAEERGLDGVAITDYGTVKGALKARTKSEDVLVIPGCETRTDCGHVLALGVEQPLPLCIRFSDALKRIRNQNGLAVLAHPYAGLPRKSVWMRNKPDAVEAVNALYPFFSYFTGKSRALAESLDLPQVGGSDAHYASNVGDAYTVVETDGFSEEAVLGGIRKGLTWAEGWPSGLVRRLRIGLGFIHAR